MAQAIHALHADNDIRINPIIVAEVAVRFPAFDLLLEACATFNFAIEPLTLIECHRAGQAFAEYRRREGKRTTILPDFLIGAQAEIRGWPLVTRDRKGFASYFPDLKIIDPLEEIA